ncbi:MAG: hypothetical protein HOP11_03785 [Saprospiraceae bacterium]|nr:hypothetical protein [Saprospiraceae bacterium]
MGLTIMIVCDLNWWEILLSWLIPFVLGYLLGNMFRPKSSSIKEVPNYSRINPNVSIADNSNSIEIVRLNQRNLELEAILTECRTRSNTQEVEIITLKDELEKCKLIKTSVSEIQKTEIQDFPIVKAKQNISEKIDPLLAKRQEFEMIDKAEESNIDLAVFQKLNTNNLQIFEGLGPKMEAFLNSENVYSWEDLSRQNSGELKKKLELIDPKYRILETDSWPIQAKHACKGEWDRLIEYQKNLSAGKSKDDKIITESKLEKILVKMGLLRRYKKDDFKAIEGIGPKIEKLLNENGIWTWSQLSIFDLKALRNILEKAGERYQLADPTTWPYQAGLANEGKWKELFDYQDTLKGGKIV